MYTTYRLKTDELGEDFLDSLRALFKDKTIEIAVCEAEDEAEDETAYLPGAKGATGAPRARSAGSVSTVGVTGANPAKGVPTGPMASRLQELFLKLVAELKDGEKLTRKAFIEAAVAAGFKPATASGHWRNWIV